MFDSSVFRCLEYHWTAKGRFLFFVFQNFSRANMNVTSLNVSFIHWKWVTYHPQQLVFSLLVLWSYTFFLIYGQNIKDILVVLNVRSPNAWTVLYACLRYIGLSITLCVCRRLQLKVGDTGHPLGCACGVHLLIIMSRSACLLASRFAARLAVGAKWLARTFKWTQILSVSNQGMDETYALT
jgi:hypothetical protein